MESPFGFLDPQLLLTEPSVEGGDGPDGNGGQAVNPVQKYILDNESKIRDKEMAML